ncbi:MAG: hypothetical protein AAFX58_15585, partial [Pseudomonadota bacterium]
MPPAGGGWTTKPLARLWLLAVMYWLVLPAADAGEIAGLPANAPASTDGGFTFGFYNDFLGRGGRNDDFRTQQLIL